MLRRWMLVLMVTASVLQPASVRAQGNCAFVLGFRTLHDLIPNIVGDCLVDEHSDLRNGNSLQETTGRTGAGGLLVWRKSDNWAAFTDGYHTWVNGPDGLHLRLNTERFPWEHDQSAVGSANPAPTPDNVANDLDDVSSSWNMTPDPAGSAVQSAASNEASTEGDGSVLLLQHLGGNVAYASSHFYRTIASTLGSRSGDDPGLNAQAFELNLIFWLKSPTTYANCPTSSRIQALEVGIAKREGSQMFEWVVQWQNVGTQVNSCDASPRWRIWTGLPGSDDTTWLDIGPAEKLAPNTPYSLHLVGDIASNGNARYLVVEAPSLSCSHLPGSCLPNQSFPPWQTGDGLSFRQLDVEVQLDGNQRSDAYDVALDQVDLGWWATTPPLS